MYTLYVYIELSTHRIEYTLNRIYIVCILCMYTRNVYSTHNVWIEWSYTFHNSIQFIHFMCMLCMYKLNGVTHFIVYTLNRIYIVCILCMYKLNGVTHFMWYILYSIRKCACAFERVCDVQQHTAAYKGACVTCSSTLKHTKAHCSMYGRVCDVQQLTAAPQHSAAHHAAVRTAAHENTLQHVRESVTFFNILNRIYRVLR